MLVYLAGPIDNVGHNEAGMWRQSVSEILKRHGIACYDPFGAFRNVEKSVHAEAVNSINMTALDVCDIVFAYFNPDVISIGTSMEISISKHPVYVWCTKKEAAEKLLSAFVLGNNVRVVYEQFLNDAIQFMIDDIGDRNELT